MNSTPQDLEGKAECAVIAFLKSHPVLKACSFAQANSEDAKTNGLIVVSAKRGPEVNPPSGVYKVNVTIDFSMRVQRGQSSLATFRNRCAAVGQRLETHPVILADTLTKMRYDWHCYWAEIQNTDNTPKDDKHTKNFELQIEAMPVTFSQADKLKPVLVTKSNF